MARQTDSDFCESVSREHCGCMLLNTCSTLAANVCVEHKAEGRALPARLAHCFAAYNHARTRETRANLCDAMWPDTDRYMRQFLMQYERYKAMRSRHEVRALLGQLDRLEAATSGTPPRRMPADH
jgi:hypothetical protein